MPFPFSVPKRISANQSCYTYKHTNVPLSWNLSVLYSTRIYFIPASTEALTVTQKFPDCKNSEYAVLNTMKHFHWPTCGEWPLWHSYKTFCWLQIITRGLLASLHSFWHRVCDARDNHYDSRLLTRKEWALWQKYHTSCWLHSLAGTRPDFPGRVALELTARMWRKRPRLWQAASNQGMSIIS